MGTRPVYLRLAVNAAGAAVAACETMDYDEAPPYADPITQVVARDAAGPWSPAWTLSSVGVLGVRPEVFVDRAGRMTAAWGERDGRAWSVHIASRTVGALAIRRPTKPRLCTPPCSPSRTAKCGHPVAVAASSSSDRRIPRLALQCRAHRDPWTRTG